MPTPVAQNVEPGTGSAQSGRAPSPLALIQTLTDEIAARKPSWQTGEFYLVTAFVAFLSTLMALGQIPNDWNVFVGGGSALGFAWLRNNRKSDREASILSLINTLIDGAAQLHAVAAPVTEIPRALVDRGFALAPVPAPLPATQTTTAALNPVPKPPQPLPGAGAGVGPNGNS